jgi:hypothetical protein
MAGGRWRKKKGGRPEVEGAPDMWDPHVRERKRGERRRALGEPAWAGRERAAAGRRGLDRFGFCFVFFFFSFFFKSISNQFFKPFLNQIFYIF